VHVHAGSKLTVDSGEHRTVGTAPRRQSWKASHAPATCAT
jgi:hypothetical protein